MNVLEKILEEIKEKGREISDKHWGDDELHLVGKAVQEMCVQSINIIENHIKNINHIFSDDKSILLSGVTSKLGLDIKNNQRNLYEINYEDLNNIKPVSEEFLEDCKRTAEKYRKKDKSHKEPFMCLKTTNKLIENLKNMQDELDTNGELDMDILHIAKFWSKYISDAIEVLERNDNDDWIPCSKRLPQKRFYENGEPIEYLATIRGVEEPTTLFINGKDEWMDFINVYYYKDYTKYDVVAWRPLPKPYENEQDISDGVKEHIMKRFMEVR